MLSNGEGDWTESCITQRALSLDEVRAVQTELLSGLVTFFSIKWCLFARESVDFFPEKNPNQPKPKIFQFRYPPSVLEAV